MVGFAQTARRTAFGLAAAAFVGIAPAFAGDFTQDECKGIRVTAGEIVRTAGKDNLSREFRKSFVNWMGADLRCDGPKDIIIRTENDSATYRTIRMFLLSGSHPLSLEKAGLRVVVQPLDKISGLPKPQQRSEAAQAALSVN